MIDDLYGGKAAETVAFGLDGVREEIDLTKKIRGQVPGAEANRLLRDAAQTATELGMTPLMAHTALLSDLPENQTGPGAVTPGR